MSLIEKSRILLPNGDVDLSAFAVVACDQFTSNADYWAKAEEIANGKPSALHFILPEIYLETSKEQKRLAELSEVTKSYLGDVLTTSVDGFVAVERTLHDGSVRQGLVAAIDLERYAFDGSPCDILPTERTVASRIPSRCEARRLSALECPHILMLLGDAACGVIEPLFPCKGELLYDTPLQQGGGSIKGYAITDNTTVEQLKSAVTKLYVGDGNHSLAAAKTLYEEIKTRLGATAQHHPARYCLAEIINLYSPALPVLPIHRAFFGCDAQHIETAAAKLFSGGDGELIIYGGEEKFVINYDEKKYPVTVLAADELFAEIQKAVPGAHVDYIHGDEELMELVREGAAGCMMPYPEKEKLIPYIEQNGVFPKKYFSLGHGADKRYYIECRNIIEER